MNILLFGDSICQNYAQYVSEKMENEANVFYVRDNARYTTFALRYLHEWFTAIGTRNDINFDIIHFNCGLWDVLRLSNENRTFSSPKEYEMGLVRIIDRIRWFYPSAKLIFALTTKVVEPGFEPGIVMGERRNSDIRKFNKIAQNVCEKYDVCIDDLWKISEIIPLEGRTDDVHFETEIGMQLLGEQVIRCLKEHI